MAALRPLGKHFPQRPSIYEIAASILTPTPKCHARQSHRLTQTIQSSHPSKPSRSLSTLPTIRHLHSTQLTQSTSHPPKTHDRGPPSSEKTQTDFSSLDVLGGTPVPSTSIDACLWDGFHLNNGVKITQGAGVLLIGGEAFGWRPWDAGKGEGKEGKRLLNRRGQWEVDDSAWGLLELVWPKPG